MSRIAKAPIELPSGVEIKIAGSEVSVKGPKGNLVQQLHPAVSVEQEDKTITVTPASNSDIPMAGTFRSLVNNMVVGVSNGFEKKLTLVGVGYRAQVQGSKLTLALGYSHPIEYTAPEGVTIEAPRQAASWPGCFGNPFFQVAGALQGQGRPLFGRACCAEGGQESLIFRLS